MTFSEKLINDFDIDAKLLALCEETAKEVSVYFEDIDKVSEFNSLKVLSAMQKNRLSDIHFNSAAGYGYNDAGREALEGIYSEIFNAEQSLVRPQLISGTHALSTALFGNLRHGDALLLPAGKPYDTLCGVIGLRKTKGSLKEHGVDYRLVELMKDGSFDYPAIKDAIQRGGVKLAAIQRSRGYSWRRSFSLDEIGGLIEYIKGIDKSIICMVDNCYGEFACYTEPGDCGADLTVGSLIKNPGGGLAPAGGYISGKEEFVENAAFHLTAPGLGGEVGPTLGLTRQLIQGLFLAPGVVAASLKGAVFTAALFEKLGYKVSPASREKRSDIVQAIKFGDRAKAEAFLNGIQKGSPVDSFVTLNAARTPGYDCDIMMAAGTFIQGSSIELSADAPLREPYAVYMQGGISWPYAKLGVMIAANNLIKSMQ